MTICSNKPLPGETRLLLAYAAAKLARKREERSWEDDGGRTIARPAPVPIGDPPR